MKQLSILDDREWPSTGFSFELPLKRESAALGVIDVQNYVLDTDGHFAYTVNQHNHQLQ